MPPVNDPRGGAGREWGRGANVRYTDSQPAITTFTVQKPQRGVKRRGKCVARPKKKPKKKRKLRKCTRYKAVGSFTHQDVAGPNRFKFTGRVKGRKLKRGRYRLQAVPRFDGVDGEPTTAGFRIIR